MPKITIWTEAYRPFILGGDVHAPISTTVEVGDAIDVGKGMKAFVVVSPKGKIHIAESVTGAFVGESVDDVKADIAAADKKVMKSQIEHAKKRLARATALAPEEFWKSFR